MSTLLNINAITTTINAGIVKIVKLVILCEYLFNDHSSVMHTIDHDILIIIKRVTAPITSCTSRQG